jgi:hypothetical protein
VAAAGSSETAALHARAHGSTCENCCKAELNCFVACTSLEFATILSHSAGRSRLQCMAVLNCSHNLQIVVESCIGLERGRLLFPGCGVVGGSTWQV